MNVKIKDQNLCFKITEEELNTLLSEHPVYTTVNILDKIFVVTIASQNCDGAMDISLVQDHNNTHLNLFVSLEKLQELLKMGRNCKGIESRIDGLIISLQVDVRSDSRKSVKR